VEGTLCVSAVQHERGPRKPKNKGDHGAGGNLLSPSSDVSSKLPPLMLSAHPPPPPPPPSLGGHLPVMPMPSKPEPSLSLPSPDFGATAPLFMPQPPGLLQILVSAEKCQVGKAYLLILPTSIFL
jgi:hypothetical protein